MNIFIKKYLDSIEVGSVDLKQALKAYNPSASTEDLDLALLIRELRLKQSKTALIICENALQLWKDRPISPENAFKQAILDFQAFELPKGLNE